MKNFKLEYISMKSPFMGLPSNFEDYYIPFSSSTNVILGTNGSGKTRIFEAIKSIYSGKKNDLIKSSLQHLPEIDTSLFFIDKYLLLDFVKNYTSHTAEIEKWFNFLNTTEIGYYDFINNCTTLNESSRLLLTFILILAIDFETLERLDIQVPIVIDSVLTELDYINSCHLSSLFENMFSLNSQIIMLTQSDVIFSTFNEIEEYIKGEKMIARLFAPEDSKDENGKMNILYIFDKGK